MDDAEAVADAVKLPVAVALPVADTLDVAVFEDDAVEDAEEVVVAVAVCEKEDDKELAAVLLADAPVDTDAVSVDVLLGCPPAGATIKTQISANSSGARSCPRAAAAAEHEPCASRPLSRASAR